MPGFFLGGDLLLFSCFRELNFGGDDKDQSSNVTPGTGYR